MPLTSQGEAGKSVFIFSNIKSPFRGWGMTLTNEIIKQRLLEKFGNQVYNFEEPYGMLTFETPKEMNLKIMQFLFDDEELRFRFLTTLCAVHYPEQKGRELAIVYHLHNLIDNIRIRFKVFTDIN